MTMRIRLYNRAHTALLANEAQRRNALVARLELAAQRVGRIYDVFGSGDKPRW
jgi:hypothetical protein